jgi:mono/diheme cytochrome c family protein
MKRFRWQSAGGAGLAVLMLLSGAVAVADDGQVAAGAELYSEFCQNCHGPDKSGLKAYSGDIDAFTERLDGLTDEMPDFADFFEEDEIVQLYAYLSAE